MKYQVTGNDFISLPSIRETDGAAEGLTFLHMGAKGMIEVKGQKQSPLLQPLVNGQHIVNPKWNRQEDWIPSFACEAEGFHIQGTILTPLHERAFFYRLQATNSAAHENVCRLGMRGNIGEVWHEVNESKQLEGVLKTKESGWNHRFVAEYALGLPLFAFAPMAEADVTHKYQADGNTLNFLLERETTIQPGETLTVDFIFGLGFDEVASATSAKELLRRGYEAMALKMKAWLYAYYRNVKTL